MESIRLVSENIIFKIEHQITEDEADTASYLIKEELNVEGERHAVDLSLVKEEKEQDNADGSDEWNELRVKEEQEEEVPLPASVTLHPVKEEENEQPLAEDPLQMVACEAAAAGEEQQSVPSKEKARNGEGANVAADLSQTQEDSRTARSGSGSSGHGKILEGHAERHLKCNVCGSSHLNERKLIAHMRIHTRYYQCGVCNRSFSQERFLIRHTQVHTGKQSNKCDMCGRYYSSKWHLKAHMRKHTERQCGVRGTYFSRECDLATHNSELPYNSDASSTGEWPFKCIECNRSFPVRHGLTVHMKTHTWKRPYKCALCGTSFLRKIDLDVHMEMHTGERQHPCDVCGTSFRLKDNLAAHMETHSAPACHKCEVCGAVFTTRRILTGHMRTHTGERPYKCDVCGSTFPHRASLISHTRTHVRGTYRERPYKCDQCGKSYRRSSSLFLHKCNAHRGSAI